jgi:hypothetical protein
LMLEKNGENLLEMTVRKDNLNKAVESGTP